MSSGRLRRGRGGKRYVPERDHRPVPNPDGNREQRRLAAHAPGSPPVPQAVRELAAQLEDATGHPPELSWLPARRWRLTMANDRVVMTYDLKPTSGGRWVRARSTLTIDGEDRGLAANFEHFVRIWRDPAEFDRRELAPPIPVLEPIPYRTAADAPGEVRQRVEQLAGRVEAKGATVRVGQGGAGYWTIEVTTGDGVVLRLHHRQRGNGSGWYLDERLIQLAVNGDDQTALVAGSLERAMGMLHRPAHDAAPGSPPVPAAAGPARSNAVETRRAAVIRT